MAVCARRSSGSAWNPTIDLTFELAPAVGGASPRVPHLVGQAAFRPSRRVARQLFVLAAQRCDLAAQGLDLAVQVQQAAGAACRPGPATACQCFVARASAWLRRRPGPCAGPGMALRASSSSKRPARAGPQTLAPRQWPGRTPAADGGVPGASLVLPVRRGGSWPRRPHRCLERRALLAEADRLDLGVEAPSRGQGLATDSARR